MTTHRASRRLACAASLGLLSLVAAVPIAEADTASAGELLTARVQEIPQPVGELSVNWKGRSISALPARIRLASQASPISYSLDIERPLKYGVSYTAAPFGTTKDPYRLPQAGVRNPVPATLAARGGIPSGRPAAAVADDLEAAARQVAVWTHTNDFRISPESVPNPRLRTRASALAVASRPNPNVQVPLQPSLYNISIFTRESTASKVTLSIALTVNDNTDLDDPQRISLYLDGQPAEVRTKFKTHVDRAKNGRYSVADSEALVDTGNTEAAEVVIDRNTTVLDVSVVWFNIESEPGVVLVSDDEGAPLLTGETVTLNFSTTSRLNPDDYVGPSQILDKTGILLLAGVPDLLVLPILVVGIFLLTRLGRVVEWGFLKIVARVRRHGKGNNPDPSRPVTVIVEADSVPEAVRAGVTALGGRSEALRITVLRQARRSGPGRKVSVKALVQLAEEDPDTFGAAIDRRPTRAPISA